MPGNEAPSEPNPEDVSLLPLLRALFECDQQFRRLGTRIIEAHDLTPSQFDVLVTLGDTRGMTCKSLSRRSLVSGGTLNPVVERMAAKGLVQRSKGRTDSRQTIVELTPEGQALYERVFPAFVDQMLAYQAALEPAEQDELVRLLRKLTASLARVP